MRGTSNGVAALVVISCVSAVKADEIVPLPVARELLELTYSAEDGALDVDKRIGLAKAISAACKSYRRIVPTITPDEQAWLYKEIGKESSSERMVAAADSEIFARYKAAQFLDECLAITDIITAIDDAVSWAFLAKLFADDDISEHLARTGVRSLKSEDITASRMMLGRDTASIIIERILVPALMK